MQKLRRTGNLCPAILSYGRERASAGDRSLMGQGRTRRVEGLVAFKAGGRRWHARPNVLALVRDEIVPRLDGANWQKQRRSRRLAWFDTADGPVFVKKRLMRKPRALLALRYLLGRTHTQREWRNHLTAWRRQEPVPEPLAFAERSPLRAEYDSFIAMRAFESTLVSFRAWAKPLAVRAGGRLRRRALRRVAALLAEMHERGAYHLDFTAMNLWGRVGDGEWQPETVIDLEKFQFGAPDDDRLALAVLQRAYLKLEQVKRREAAAFLLHYLKCRRIERGSPRYERFAAWLERLASDGARWDADGVALKT